MSHGKGTKALPTQQDDPLLIHLARVIYIINGTEGDDRMTGGLSDGWYDGRGGNDQINGGGGNDILDGGAGDDRLDGGDGADLATYATTGGPVRINLALTTAQDTLSAGMDTLISIEDLSGSSYADTLFGNAGANVIDGGPGADIMRGGGGDDTYYAGASDTVTEYSNGGLDTVYASGSFTLGSNIEALVLTGTVNSRATGNMLANTLTGNDGNNILNGRTGADVMAGGAGDDTYVVDAAGDVTIELGDAGYDVVQSGVSRMLGDNLEGLVLTGTAGIRGTGNAGSNTMTGNGAGNVLDGMGGNDELSGGRGADMLIGGAGADVIRLGDDSDIDIARFRSINDSVVGASRDLVHDFASGEDLVDLQLIDANINAGGNQVFGWSASGTAANSVWVESGTSTIVRGDVTGDGVADFEIELVGVASVAQADFIL